MKIERITGLLYVIFSIVNIGLCLLFNVDSFVYILFLFLLESYFTKCIHKETFLIYALFLPNKYLQLLTVPVFLVMERKLFKNRMDMRKTAFIAYLFVVSVLNCVLYNGFFTSSLFQIGLYYCVFRLIKLLQEDFDQSIVYCLFDQMFWLQCITAMLQLVALKAAMDALTGTLISAHYLSIFLLVYMFMLVTGRNDCKSGLSKSIRFLIGLVILVLSDAKHVWASFLLALTVVTILYLFKMKNKITVSVLLMTGGIAATLFLAKLPFMRSLLQDSFLYPYVYSINYNKKFVFFSNTLQQMCSWNGLVGFGAGQYGSQICLTMSKGIIYNWNPLLEKYHFAGIPYADAIRGVMSEWYVKKGIGTSSMVLGYPLVSFAGFIGELGIIGLSMLLRIFDGHFRRGNPVFIIFFFMISVFDTYFEIPCVFILLLLAANMQKGKECIIRRGCYDT